MWAVQRRNYKKLLGKVRYALMGVPGSDGLFTPINMALKEQSKWVKMSADVKEALKDFCLLLNTAAANPAHVNELVQGALA